MTSSPPAAGVTSPASTVTSPASTKNLLSPSPRKSPLLGFRNHNKNAKNNNTLNIPQEDTDESPKKHVTKFNFHRHSKKKKDTRRDRRERKATTTLAIVLGKPNFLNVRRISFWRNSVWKSLEKLIDVKMFMQWIPPGYFFHLNNHNLHWVVLEECNVFKTQNFSFGINPFLNIAEIIRKIKRKQYLLSNGSHIYLFM